MDPNRFDAFIQSFATPGSRRRVLGGLLAGAVEPLTAAKAKRREDRGPAPAKCLANGKRCSLPDDDASGHGKHKGKGGKGKHHPRSCKKCCSRFGAAGPNGKPRCSCKPEGESCDSDVQCCGGLCRNGACTKCPGDLTVCNGNCVDLQTDPQHCGDCGTTCANGQRCVDGTCVCDATSCPNGCCDADAACQRGTSDGACGDGGAACQTCDECSACDGTTCAAEDAVCCGDDAVCDAGVCSPCASGQRCDQGACVCDATSCAGCCDGATCLGGTDDSACGENGDACVSCQPPNTCAGGNPGTPGKCGCTPNCTNKCSGQDDGCGGKCGCPKCQKCHDAGSFESCAIDYESFCEDGQRCCLGRCPATGCTKPDQCCSNSNAFACLNICCAPSVATVPTTTCPSTQRCGEPFTGNLCDGDGDCAAGSEVCDCGQCCKVSGQPCSQPADCCTFTCKSDGTCF